MSGIAFYLFHTFLSVVAAIVFLTIIRVVVTGLWTWQKNNQSPQETVIAKVISKRQEVSGMNNMTSTAYFLTFEMDGQDRQEYQVSSKQYALIAEGDLGYLTYQGTRFIRFERQ